MQKIIRTACLFLFSGISVIHAQNGNTAAHKPSAAKISFAKDSFNFGTVPQGKPVTHAFTFRNTGKEPLVLNSVTASCGCTTPEWPKEPIKPGESGVIKATYNAQAVGIFIKTVTVLSNASTGTRVLTIRGEVKPVQVPKKNSAESVKQSPLPAKN